LTLNQKSEDSNPGVTQEYTIPSPIPLTPKNFPIGHSFST